MLIGVSKQIAHCFFRAARCNERAALAISVADREFCLEREKAWLALARSYELQERLCRVVNERQRRRGRGGLPTRIVPVANCPSCDIEMLFQGSQPVSRIFLPTTMVSERVFFHCPNCARLVEQLMVEC